VVLNDPKFHLSLTRLAEVNKQVDELNAEAAVLASEVKERSIKEFTRLYDSTGKYPGSFILRGSGLKGQPTASLMFIPTDKYIKIGEDRYNELVESYGEGIATEKTTYTMNTELVEKYGEIISTLIEKCKDIPKDDKEKLISAVTSYEIKKGTISDLPNFPATIAEMLEEIKPVYQLKNIKLDEEV
jgi:hypothetical protein